VFEKIADAAEVHRLTGTAPAVAMHFPWDAVDNLDELSEQLAESGLCAGAVNPNLFQDPDYKLGSITNPDAGIRRKAVEHLLECVRIAAELGSTAQSLWLADGTNYAGQDDLRARRDRLQEGLAEYYAALPPEQELLVEYKFFEPAFYATDIGDWGSALLLCHALGERARVLVDLGHHAQGVNVEQIVAILAREGRLGGFHFNNRKYADDDLIVGSVNPMELFLIFAELGSGGLAPAGGVRLTIDQSHNIEAKVEAMVLSVVNLQESYAKSLLIDRGALAEAQGDGDVLRGHELLLDAFNTDVRPLCAKVRGELGAAADPVGELRASGYAQRMVRERGAASAPRRRATTPAGLGVTE
jgi:L-rhamnose isomerase/sugar isomerase